MSYGSRQLCRGNTEYEYHVTDDNECIPFVVVTIQSSLYFTTYHRICNKGSTTCASSGAGTSTL